MRWRTPDGRRAGGQARSGQHEGRDRRRRGARRSIRRVTGCAPCWRSADRRLERGARAAFRMPGGLGDRHRPARVRARLRRDSCRVITGESAGGGGLGRSGGVGGDRGVRELARPLDGGGADGVGGRRRAAPRGRCLRHQRCDAAVLRRGGRALRACPPSGRDGDRVPPTPCPSPARPRLRARGGAGPCRWILAMPRRGLASTTTSSRRSSARRTHPRRLLEEFRVDGPGVGGRVRPRLFDGRAFSTTAMPGSEEELDCRTARRPASSNPIRCASCCGSARRVRLGAREGGRRRRVPALFRTLGEQRRLLHLARRDARQSVRRAACPRHRAPQGSAVAPRVSKATVAQLRRGSTCCAAAGELAVPDLRHGVDAGARLAAALLVRPCAGLLLERLDALPSTRIPCALTSHPWVALFAEPR